MLVEGSFTIRGSLALTIVTSCLLAGAWASADPSTDFDFVNAMYGPWEVEELGNFSFDAKYRNAWWHHSGRERILQLFATESERAAASNVTYVAGLYYHAAPWDRLPFNYTHAVHYSGTVEPYTPSPIDETWWERTMHEPAVAVANLSLHYPIWGLVWDIELYGHAAMLRHDYSYDLPAIHAFANESGISVPELKANRGYQWLAGEGLLSGYHKWMEDRMYDIAKRTEQEVHAINPSFHLGLLGTEDSWHHWTILRAFNSSTASVTSWGEQTYGGWDRERVALFQRRFEEYGLNGKYVPGIRPSASLGKLMYDWGSAVRDNGVFWVYQHNGDPWAYRNRSYYVEMYRIFDHYVFFGGEDAYPLPGFDLLPGAGAHPYLDPQGDVSLFIYTHMQDKAFEKELVPFPFSIRTESPTLVYVGENLSTRILKGPLVVLRPEDLPCILQGLSEEDLVALRAVALRSELGLLLELFDRNGIGEPSFARSLLGLAEGEIGEGRYGDVVAHLMERRNQTYDFALDAVRPLVERGFANPRESEVPLSILRTFYLAQGEFDRGEVRQGEMSLILGLRQLASVPEGPWVLVLPALPLALSRRSRRRLGTIPCLARIRNS